MACNTYNRDQIAWLSVQLMRQLLVVRYQVGDVDIAIVLLDKHVLTNLISLKTGLARAITDQLFESVPVYEGIINLELQDEFHKALLDIDTAVRFVGLRAPAEADAQCVY